ncbi:MAG TPA: cupin domain-containing protein [Thermodesulfobacteriota bacterium]|nr:cupin domain-containing protein [Thermodesulfobacteriota bacterium]
MGAKKQKYLLKAGEIKKMQKKFSHPWNPKSELVGARLGVKTGLVRTGVNIATIPPGKESFVYHSHTFEEEWIYVLTGSGVAEIDGKEYKVGPGDFMGFPTPGVAHNLRNDGKEDLVYLVGGESREHEIAEYPRLGRKMIRTGEKVEVLKVSDVKDFKFWE